MIQFYEYKCSLYCYTNIFYTMFLHQCSMYSIMADTMIDKAYLDLLLLFYYWIVLHTLYVVFGNNS